MTLSDDDLIEKYVKRYCQCRRNNLLPYEYEWPCVLCGFIDTKRKNELSKIQRKILIFIN